MPWYSILYYIPPHPSGARPRERLAQRAGGGRSVSAWRAFLSIYLSPSLSLYIYIYIYIYTFIFPSPPHQSACGRPLACRVWAWARRCTHFASQRASSRPKSESASLLRLARAAVEEIVEEEEEGAVVTWRSTAVTSSWSRPAHVQACYLPLRESLIILYRADFCWTSSMSMLLALPLSMTAAALLPSPAPLPWLSCYDSDPDLTCHAHLPHFPSLPVSARRLGMIVFGSASRQPDHPPSFHGQMSML